jgi:hypothetical protein
MTLRVMPDAPIETSPSDWLRLVYLPKGTPERIRTSDRRIRNPLLYPTELRGQLSVCGRNPVFYREPGVLPVEVL